MNHYEGDTRVGRAESPAIEYAFQDEIVRLLKELFESKGLYQNVRVNTAIFDDLPNDFAKEFRKRPISPYSPNDQGTLTGSLGCQPLGTPHDELDIGFYLPNINLECSRCTRATTFLSIGISPRAYTGSPYPILGDDTEQVFSVYYKCAVCHKTYIVFQVFRIGFKLQLTGRSIPFRPTIEKEWPKEIRQIVEDAHVAAAENDVPAAYYHLRTAMEFYLKKELSIAVADKIDGTTLCDKYNEKVDSRLKSGFPAVSTIYSELSTGLHSRDVKAERFMKLRSDFLSHLKAKALFAEYSSG
jgi:hypothetical protein